MHFNRNRKTLLEVDALVLIYLVGTTTEMESGLVTHVMIILDSCAKLHTVCQNYIL